MGEYAKGTSVSVERSMEEIRRSLQRYGADCFGYLDEPGSATVGFRVHGKMVRFVVPLPDRTAAEFTRTPDRGLKRTAKQAEAAYDQEVRRRWRALSLVVKAKLEAVSSGIVTFDQEFFAHFVLPNGQTVWEHAGEPTVQAIARNEMPAIGMFGGGGERIALPAPEEEGR